MGTRSNIVVKRADGKFARIYCHWDGYISNNGLILQQHYNGQERAEAVVAPGDMSSLDARCDKPEGHTFDKAVEGYTTYYGRDRGEEGTEARVYDTLDEALEDGMEEYLYLWTDGGWFVTEDLDAPNRGFKSLAQALKDADIEVGDPVEYAIPVPAKPFDYSRVAMF